MMAVKVTEGARFRHSAGGFIPRLFIFSKKSYRM